MARHNILNLAGLINKINSLPDEADKVAVNVINRSATFATKKSIDEILRTNNLQRTYVESKFKTVARASKSNLRAIVRANDRRTLLARYSHYKTSDGVSISVKKGSSKVIKKGFVVKNLRGSFATGIAVTNLDFVKYLQTSSTSSNLRGKKLQKALSRLSKRPKGFTVLHGASINQMFERVRFKIKQPLKRFMVQEFLEEFGRRN